ncbi:alpha/beta fold hydrolase [Geitlerinema sp. PCC 7407]|uniref:alpha/beta fold hydrolase n=1 Tax=Geitlerinema sp. PCC 7407 TaxID=1173025 RepID=UPI00029FAA15|nr:alpha/beta hydrolase [Geitlerinema sp. PCC 7407]AFY66156.1 alpha/beta hydrolase fold protein [Geitlerinema sp. PCC 7407]
MFQPPGFVQRSIVTSLGTMVYHTTAEEAPWASASFDPAPLVFFHGFGGGSSSYEWSKVYPAFAADYRVIAPDLVGWGRSAHPARDYEPEDYVTTLREFLEQVSDRPVIAVASSLTAAYVVRVAIARPELFRALILVTPAGLSDFGENYTRSLFAQVVKTPVVDRLLYTFGIATAGGIRSFLEQRQFADRDRIYPEIVEAYLASASQPNAEYAALSFVRGDLCFDLARYMPELTTPTFMIWGEKSQFTGPEIGRRLAALNPQAVRVFHALEGVGLTPQLEIPAVTIALIRSFLQEIEATAALPA